MAATPTDWQLECTELKQRGAYLLQTGQWSDCTFLVGTEPNQIVLAGHKLILAMASPVFEAMFYGGIAERNGSIPIVDVEIDTFKALLEYIYTDNVNISSYDKACELCYMAKKYMLPHLAKQCTIHLFDELNPINACRAYEFARLFEENVLMEKCIEIISTNTKEVLNDSSFEEVELNTVITVFSLDHLDVDSELDLFEGAVRYAKALENRTERSSSPPSESGSRMHKSHLSSTSQEKYHVVNVNSNAEYSPEAVIKTHHANNDLVPPSIVPNKIPQTEHTEEVSIRSAIEKIRFLTLSPEEFAAGPGRSSLLTESEAFAVLMNIVSATTDIPMLSGFSTSRLSRKEPYGDEPSCTENITEDLPSPVMEDSRPSWQDGIRSPCPIPEQACDINNRGRKLFGFRNRRIYCTRQLLQHPQETYYLWNSDCSVTFMVDKEAIFLGVQIPSRLCEGSYTELLTARLLDEAGAHLSHAQYGERLPARCGGLLDVMFDTRVYLSPNKLYKVGVSFKMGGDYPKCRCMQEAEAKSVSFKFGIGHSSDSVKDDVIRSIIFTDR